MGLDRTDFAIVDALQNDARLSNKELAARVGLAPSSCLVRVRRLVRDKALRGFHAEVDPEVLGVGLQAIFMVRLAKHSRVTFRSFTAHVRALPEVVQVFCVSGVNDLVVHVAVRDVAHLHDWKLSRLATRREVAHIETSVVFSLFRQPRLPCYRQFPRPAHAARSIGTRSMRRS